MRTFYKTVSYYTGPEEMDNSKLIPVELSTSNQTVQQGNILFSKTTDNFDYCATPDQVEISEQNIMSNVNSSDHYTDGQQMTLNSCQSGM